VLACSTLIAIMFLLTPLLSASPILSVSVDTDEPSYRRGELVTISGQVLADGNPVSGASVGIKVMDPDGNLKFVDQLSTNTSGFYSTSFRIGSDWPLGKYVVEVSAYYGATGEEATASTTFLVRIPSEITISIRPSTISIGESTTISGDIDPDPGVPVEVTIVISGPVSAELTVTSDSDGSYSISYKPPKLGTYNIYAKWSGTEQIEPSTSSTAKLGVVKKPSEIVVEVSPDEVEFGGKVEITGYIKPAEAGADQTVTLQYEHEGVKKLIATVKARADGSFEYEWVPPGTGVFKIIASWPGTDIYEGATGTTTLKVLRASSKLTISVDPDEITLEESTTISGVLDPPLKGIEVMIEYSYEGGSWTKIVTVETGDNGEFSYEWTPRQAGDYSIRASWEGNENYEPATSSEVSLKVKSAPTTITIEVDKVEVNVGEEVRISGELKSWANRPLPEFNVKIKVVDPEDREFEYPALTDESGRYEVSIIIDTKGTWRIQAVWEGDGNYLRSESSIVEVEGKVVEVVVGKTVKTKTEVVEKKPTLKVVEEVPIKMEVVTNSTLKKIELKKNTIIAEVEGAPGTKGYLTISIQKDMLERAGLSIDDIRVIVKGKEVPFEYKETPTSYIITVTYKHSVVKIEVKLGFKLMLKSIDHENAVLAGALVELYRGGELVNSTYTDVEGRAEFLMLPKDSYDVRVLWRGAEVFRESIRVAEDINVTARTKVYTLKVLVTGMLGIPASGIKVKAILPDGTPIEEVTKADGTAVFRQVPIGTYEVTSIGLTTDKKTVNITGPITVKLKVFSTMDLAVIGAIIAVAVICIILVVRKRR